MPVCPVRRAVLTRGFDGVQTRFEVRASMKVPRFRQDPDIAWVPAWGMSAGYAVFGHGAAHLVGVGQRRVEFVARKAAKFGGAVDEALGHDVNDALGAALGASLDQ